MNTRPMPAIDCSAAPTQAEIDQCHARLAVRGYSRPVLVTAWTPVDLLAMPEEYRPRTAMTVDQA